MKTVYAKDFGILPGNEVAEKLNGLFQKLKGDREEKILILEKAVPVYYEYDRRQRVERRRNAAQEQSRTFLRRT